MKKLYELEYEYRNAKEKYLYDVLYNEMTIGKLLEYGFNGLHDEENGYLGYDNDDFKNGVNGYSLDTMVEVIDEDEDGDGYKIVIIKKVGV